MPRSREENREYMRKYRAKMRDGGGPPLTYRAAHQKVRNEKGLPSGSPCVECGKPGAQWSYNYQDPDELTDAADGPYSASSDFYESRCASCHRRYDLWQARLLKAGDGDGEPGAAAGRSELMVQSELDGMPQAVSLPSLRAAALAMARVLDDRTAVPQHPAAAGQLRQVMAELRGVQVEKAKSPLSVLRGGRAS
jgi:hypothetical protein